MDYQGRDWHGRRLLDFDVPELSVWSFDSFQGKKKTTLVSFDLIFWRIRNLERHRQLKIKKTKRFIPYLEQQTKGLLYTGSLVLPCRLKKLQVLNNFS